MRMKELAVRSGTSTATIKFYLREGLLPPGRRVNATLAEYDESHLRRLELVATLRTVLGAPLDRIKALTDRIDDPEVALLQILADAQSLALGQEAADATLQADEEPVVTDVFAERGWPDVPSWARTALDAQVAQMRELGIAVDARTMSTYAEAADRAAALDIGVVQSAGSRDEAALVVAVGVHSYSQLLLGLLAVAQTSRSIKEFADRDERAVDRSPHRAIPGIHPPPPENPHPTG
ncbi:DNA-binding transcriptional regulator, MerR family [Raineyella antarctica]|uniref:DNA-binding transcriptional regulator, MerR family n=1 Tax=Raineyella antarctica TaxID=1577474 RepID=A0A1G6HU72_9ACTN|nr:DNA-binding transcriptional regulator, MerR family [Raineyella antarctica]